MVFISPTQLTISIATTDNCGFIQLSYDMALSDVIIYSLQQRRKLVGKMTTSGWSSWRKEDRRDVLTGVPHEETQDGHEEDG
ncbi:hypothetical protein AAC387_Pa02g1310 [Persea americana]